MFSMVGNVPHFWDVTGYGYFFSHTEQDALDNVLKKRKQIEDTVSPGNKTADMAASGGIDASSGELHSLKWMEQKGICVIPFGKK